jgi:N-acyl-D-aspartate/D-glutamate deacylase
VHRRSLLGALLALLLAGAAVAREPSFDLVLVGGRVVDGTGNPWFRADLGLLDGRIAAIGDLSAARAVERVDVTGLYLTPGFVDTHSHAGPGLATEELSDAAPLLTQGITTVFVNPDGGGAVDIAGQRTALEAHGLGVNVAQFVPHGAVRASVIGAEDRPATAAELDAMRALVRLGMEAGAWGLSSGPFYAPGSYADTQELVALARVAGAFGGAYQSHVRDESNYGIGLLAALDEVITVAREARLPGVHTHIKALGPPVWGMSERIVERIEAARAEGVEVYADQYPYLASATGLAPALLPRWAQAGGEAATRARLTSEPDASRIREAVAENLARRGGAERIQFRRVPWDETLEGRRLSEVAEQWEVEPVDAALRMLLAGGAGIVSFNMQDGDVRTLMLQRWTMTASDGGLVPRGRGVPHPRSYGTFPRRIRRFVVEERLQSLEDAVRTMTSLPAQVYRMSERGVIWPGLVADLVVFDPEALVDRATFTDPHQLSEGLTHVLIAGRFALRDGVLTGERAGAVLQRN